MENKTDNNLPNRLSSSAEPIPKLDNLTSLSSFKTILADSLNKTSSIGKDVNVKLSIIKEDLAVKCSDTINNSVRSVSSKSTELQESILEKSSTYYRLILDKSFEIKGGFGDRYLSIHNSIKESYEAIDIRKTLSSLLLTINIPLVVESLKSIKLNDKKARTAIDLLCKLLILVNTRHVKLNNLSERIEEHEIKEDYYNLTRDIDFKYALSIIEPLAYLIPYGNALVLIIRIFV